MLSFLQSIHFGLKQGWGVIIDVPNMDWLFASHERYMDFTHELGFTVESLGQLGRIYFEQVYLGGVVPVFLNKKRALFSRLIVKPINFVIRKYFSGWGIW